MTAGSRNACAVVAVAFSLLFLGLPISHGANAAAVTFDFENLGATGVHPDWPGTHTSLSISQSGLSIEIERDGDRFDISNNSSSFASSFGDRSLSPFVQPNRSSPFVINFSRPVLEVSIDAGDFGQDTPDVVRIRAYAEPNASGRLRDSDSANVRTLNNTDPFNFQTVQVQSNSLIRSVEIIGGTPIGPNSVYYDNIKVNLPSNQEASVIGSWTKLVEGAQNTRTSYHQGIIEIGDCAATPGCDIDALVKSNQQQLIQNLKNANDAAFESRTLVTKTSVLPQNNLELAVEAKGLIGEAIDFFKLVGKIFHSAEGEINNVEVSGQVGSFTINPTFDLVAAAILFDITGGTFPLELLGEEALVVSSLLGHKQGFGIATIDSIDSLGNGFDRVRFSLTEIESSSYVSAVPLPPGVWLLVSALGYLVLFGWRRRVFSHAMTL